MLTRNRPGGVTRQVGKLHHQPGETSTCPAWRHRPFDEFGEPRPYDVLRAAAVAVIVLVNASHRQLMLKFQNSGQKRVLAGEVVIERALGEAGHRRDLVDPHSAEAFLVK